MTQIMRKLCNCSFVFFLFLPFIVLVFSPAKDISLTENRKLAPLPKIHLQSFSLSDFTAQFESYWNDHLGLRDTLVAFNSILQQEIFGKSPVKKVIKGENGWLFINLHSIVSDYLGINPPKTATLLSWATILENREKWLARNNIKYIVLPVPSKMNIYSEHLPSRYSFFRKGQKKTNLEQLFVYLEKNSRFSNIVQLPPIYQREKETTKLYFKTDTHWTWQGAYLAYVEVIKKLKRWYPEIKVIPAHSLDLQQTKRNGDLARMLGSKTVLPEQTKTVKIRNSCSSKMFKLPGHNPAETKRHPVVTTCDTAKLTAVVTYDSFGAFLFPYYAAHFRRVTYVSRRDFVWLKGYLEKEKPDIFIHQRAARKLGELLHDGWGLAKELD